MPTEFTFRLSTYLTLGLACVCVGYAEADIFPEVPFIAAAVIVALAVLFRLESRVELLSIPAANRLGLTIALANIAWVTFRVVREAKTEETTYLNWQVLMVALLGPLLMTLVPAKLARREKHVGDYWGLHAAGLAAVALSGAISENLTCFILVALYAVAAIWSLSLFHVRRAAGALPRIPNRPAPPPVSGVVATSGARSSVGSGLLFSLAAVALAVPLYLLTPRSGADKLDFGKPRVEIGYAADQMINLNQTGELEPNPQAAFEVTVETEDGRSAELPPQQRWRGRVLRSYANGRWLRGDTSLPGIDTAPRNTGRWSRPVLGPDQLILKFAVPPPSTPTARGRFLADPVTWAAGQPSPIATVTRGFFQPWNWNYDGSFDWNAQTGRGETLRYVQVLNPGPDHDLSPPFRLIDPDIPDKLRPLLRNPAPRVKEYADGIVEKFAGDGKLPADYRDRLTLLPRKEFHERIARTLSHHLATTPELSYTTNLRRERKELDPVEEFLFHTREGHCERFATALALMLRSQGIPSVLVLGLKGFEETEDVGRYIVRHEHAHAWVDALIEVYEPAPSPGNRPVSRWLSLDPTPAGLALAGSDERGWTDGARTWARTVFNEYVVNFDAEKGRQSLKVLGHWLTRASVWGPILGTVCIVVVWRLRRTRRRPAPLEDVSPETLWFRQLLALLSPHGFTPTPDQTPQEFTLAVADALRARPGTEGVSPIPLEWATAYYEARFGGVPLTADRRASLEERLRELARALDRD